MYEARMLGYTIEVGTVIEIPMEGDEEFKFQVTAIQEDHFEAIWLSGAGSGQRDTVPYSLFGPKGTVSVYKVSDEMPTEPNKAFKWKERYGHE